MAHTVDSRADTPANDLRTLLDQAERQLPTLERTGLAAFLLRLDGIEAMLVESAAQGMDLRPEQTRWADLLARISARAGDLVRIAGGAGKFAELRNQHPPAASFWWRLDEQVAAARRRQGRRIAIGGAVAILLLVAATFIYQRFFAPSPATILWMDTLNAVEDSVAEQDWANAIQATDAALVTLPDDVDLLLWRVVLAERVGDVAAAAEFLARAHSAEPDPLRLAVQLGMKQLQAGDLDGATATAAAAQEIDPQLAEAAFILASVAEARGEIPQAITLFEQAAALAEPDKLELVVTSRMRLAVLLQTGALMITPEATTHDATAPEATTPEATETAP
jgi:tetratricopeptide (TPR) repeat protein